MAGDLYELKSDESDSKPVVGNGTAGPANTKAVDPKIIQKEVKPFVKPKNAFDLTTTLPAPPNGFYFHKLNTENTEVNCDAFGT